MLYEVTFQSGSRVKIEAENPEYAGILAAAERVKQKYTGTAVRVKNVEISRYIVEPVMFSDAQGYANVYETENGRVYIGGVYNSIEDAFKISKPHCKGCAYITWGSGSIIKRNK